MNKSTDTPVTSISQNSDKEAPWWNRSVMGKDGLMDDLLGKIGTQEVPEDTLLSHTKHMTELKVFGKTAQAIDDEKFAEKEFLAFAKINYLMRNDINEYEGLYESLQLLKAAIDAKHYFISIDQVELRYRGLKQQEFYNFVERLLDDHENTNAFREQLQIRLTDTLPEIKTEEEKIALQNYVKYLNKLSNNELGLQLLSRFKAYQLDDYSILRVISNFIRNLDKRDLLDIKDLVSLVNHNYSMFEKLRDVIGLDQNQSTPETYALMIQFIALYNRHGILYLKFNDLVRVLRQWYKPYQAILSIRKEYTFGTYKQPKAFKEPIPGIDIYEKYKKLLSDKKTGMVFINFSHEHQI